MKKADLYQFQIFEPFKNEIAHGVTLRSEGCLKKNPEKLETIVGHRGAFAEQIHSDFVLHINKIPEGEPKGDAWITQKQNLPLVVRLADCQGALIYDPITKSIAAIHSGWKGSVLNIIGKTIEKMQNAFHTDPMDLTIGISPSLGPCCAEFSAPSTELPPFMQRYIEGKKINLWQLSLDQCVEGGVPMERIEIAKICTRCNPENFFSHRNGNTERVACFISLK